MWEISHFSFSAPCVCPGLCSALCVIALFHEYALRAPQLQHNLKHKFRCVTRETRCAGSEPQTNAQNRSIKNDLKPNPQIIDFRLFFYLSGNAHVNCNTTLIFSRVWQKSLNLFLNAFTFSTKALNKNKEIRFTKFHQPSKYSGHVPCCKQVLHFVTHAVRHSYQNISVRNHSINSVPQI